MKDSETLKIQIAENKRVLHDLKEQFEELFQETLEMTLELEENNKRELIAKKIVILDDYRELVG